LFTNVCNYLKIGVNREFYLNWMVIDENKSWYIDENIQRFTNEQHLVDKNDPDFQLSNKMRGSFSFLLNIHGPSVNSV
jgi:hypothetical protein